MNRLLIWQHECSPEGRVILKDRRAEHLRNILRVNAGDTLRAGIIDGPCVQARVLASTGTHCELEVLPVGQCNLPAAPQMDLLLAMPRPKFFKRILPQLAILGVRRLYLTSAAKVERFYFDTHILREEHYLPLILEGLEQATDTRLPELRIVRPLRKLLTSELVGQYAPGHCLLAHPGPRSGSEVVPAAGAPLLLAIGPEGGWSEAEVELFAGLGFTNFSLGPRVLRTDMACVALLTLLDYLRQD